MEDRYMKRKLAAIILCVLMLFIVIPQSLAAADDDIYASYFGGSSSDYGRDIVVDDNAISNFTGIKAPRTSCNCRCLAVKWWQ
jgi:hypothetical protein